MSGESATDFIRSLVAAWDCCATCAGGVLARRDAPLLDRLQAAEAAVERVRAVVRNDRAAREACARDEDCGCAYKDCYECGKWHNCTHTPLAAVQTALDGPQDDAGADLSASGAESDHGGRRDGEVLA